MLRSLVASVSGLLTERAKLAPDDDLAALTGMRTGNTEPPRTRRYAACYPTSTAASRAHRTPIAPTSTALCAAYTNRRSSTPNWRRARSCWTRCRASGGKIVLTPEQADAWLTALNDVRLALGTTIGIDADTPDHLESGRSRGRRTSTSTTG